MRQGKEAEERQKQGRKREKRGYDAAARRGSCQRKMGAFPAGDGCEGTLMVKVTAVGTEGQRW